MTKTFILHCSEQNTFSIEVEAENIEEARERAYNDVNQFQPFNESSDWDVDNYEEKTHD